MYCCAVKFPVTVKSPDTIPPVSGKYPGAKDAV